MTNSEIANMIDHTILKSTATLADVETLCQEAIDNNFASVCINPCWVKAASQYLKANKKATKLSGVTAQVNKANYSKFEIAQNDAYIKSAIEIRNSYEDKYTNFSNNRKYLCDIIDIWCTGAQRPFIHLINGTSTGVDASFSSIAYLAQQNWELWTNQSK